MGREETSVSLSVAVVTCNRPQSLQRCLENLREQSAQPGEIVVADDSGAELAGRNREIAESHGCRYVEGARRGLYANRNLAALSCAGSHVRTMDDDHVLPPGHLELCLDAVKSDPQAIWTTGEVGYLDGEYRATLETANQLCSAGVGEPVADPDDNWAIADGSTIYPARIFQEGLLQVEWFPYGYSYLEYGAFLYRHGYKSRCLKGAKVEHFANRETLRRAADRVVIESQLFASLCFNLYFRPDPVRAATAAASLCLRGGMTGALVAGALGTNLRRARERWGESAG